MALVPAASPSHAQTPASGSDADAIAIANATLEKMGGREGWERARVLEWRFMGKRLHHWDKATGDVRIEADSTIILMNLNTKQGRAWTAGKELAGDELAGAIEHGYAMWINDSYWLVMPYKLLDPGVKLAFHGSTALADGRPAKLLSVTFENVGLTPWNKYDVWVGEESGLVEQWAYYEKASDEAPKFTLPWGGWTRFGPILLATDHGRGGVWEIAVFEERPAGVFDAP